MSEREEIYLPEIPPMPFEFMNAIFSKNKQLVLFIGAGISRLNGCVSWNQLAEILIEKCFEHGELNYNEKEVLKKRGTKEKISICKSMLTRHKAENSDCENSYQQTMISLFDRKNETEHSDLIYTYVCKMKSVIVTTNADTYVCRYFDPSHCFISDKDFKANKMRENTVFFLHGNIEDPKTLVFSVKEYIHKYRESEYANFLTNLFKDHIILFLGYGLEEFEVLDFLLQKHNDSPTNNLYLLKGSFKSDGKIIGLEKEYYKNNLNITTIDFSLDNKGYKQQIEIIKTWSQEVQRVSSVKTGDFVPSETVLKMKKLTQNRPTHENRDDFLNTANDDLQNRFLEYLSDSDFILEWFPYVKRYCFSESPDEEIKWEHLVYLDHLSKFVNNNIDGCDKKQVKEFTNYIEEKWENLYNRDKQSYSQTFIRLNKIITCFPFSVIEKKHIDYLGRYLNLPGCDSFIIYAIGENLIPTLLLEKETELLLSACKLLFSTRISNNELFLNGSTSALLSIINEHFLKFTDLIGIELLNFLISETKNNITLKYFESSNFGVAIEEHAQNLVYNTVERCFLIAVRILLENTKEVNNIVNKLIAKNTIFKRLALHTIRLRYEEFKKILWDNIDAIFNDFDLVHEFYLLVKELHSHFSKNEVEILKNWISNVFSEGNRTLRTTYAAHILDALKENEHVKDNFYENMNKKHQLRFYPGFYRYHTPATLGISDKYKKDIEVMTICKKVEYFNGYDDKDSNSHDSYEYKLTFRRDVRENFNDYINDYKNTITLNSLFKIILIDELCDLLSDIDYEEWLKSIEIIKSTIQEVQEDNSKNDDIIDITSKFIKTSITTKNLTPEKVLEQSKPIILKLHDKAIDKTLIDSAKHEDIFFSPLSQVLETMFVFSLRKAEIDSQNGSFVWDERIKNLIVEGLQSEFYEYNYMVASYINNLYWLDNNWIEKNYSSIFTNQGSKKDPGMVKFWAAIGYVQNSNTLLREVFDKLNTIGIWEWMLTQILDDNLFSEHVQERFSQIMCIAYLNGPESLEEGNIFRNLFDSNNIKLITSIISFIKNLKDLTDDHLEKIEELWVHIVQDELYYMQENFRRVIISSLKWVEKFNRISKDTYDCLEKIITECKKYEYNDFFKFKNVLKTHAQSAPKDVCHLFLKILENITIDNSYRDIVKEIFDSIKGQECSKCIINLKERLIAKGLLTV